MGLDAQERTATGWSKCRVWCGLFLLVYVLNLGAHLVLLPEYDAKSHQHFGGERLLSNPDGYYFLRQAQAWAQGDYTQPDPMRPGYRPEPVPPLSAMAAVVAQATGISTIRAAFFIPPVLGSLTVLIGLLLGAAAGSRRLGVMAALLTISTEAWFSRAALGGFDTDCLLPLLVFGLMYTLYRLDRGSPWWGAAALALTGGLYLWWPQAGLFFAGAQWGLFAFGGLVPGGNLRKTRLFVLFAVLALAVCWLAFGPHLPRFLRLALGPLDSHIRFALGNQTSVFTQTGWSVEELAGMPLLEALGYLCGHWSAGLAALAGLVGFAAWRPRLGLYFALPSMTMFVASMYLGNRFAMYAILVYALGLGWLCAVAVPRLLRRFGRVAAPAGWLVLAAFFGWGMHGIYTSHGLVATFDTNQVALAASIDQAARPEAAIWNWWGPGYMVQYFGQRETFFDGGLQNPERAFISAAPLAERNPHAARRWIKFFSVHPDGLRQLNRQIGFARSVGFLRAAFAAPDRIDALVAEYGLKDDRDWTRWLLPEREVYLILYSEMMMRNSWLKIGLWDERTGTSPDTPLYALPLNTLQFERTRGLLFTGKDNVVPYSKLLFVAPDSLSHDNPREHGDVVLLFKRSNMGYIIPERFFDVLAFRLLFLYPDTTPGFEIVKYNPFVGGVWRVH